MVTTSGPSNICFLQWIRWMDTINGIHLHDDSRLARTFEYMFYALQLVQLLIAYNFTLICSRTISLEKFAVQFNQFGGVLLTLSRVIAINVFRAQLKETAQFINAAKFHHLNERARHIRSGSIHIAGRFLTTLLTIQIVTLIFWFALIELQAQQQDVLLPVITYLPFDASHWPTFAKVAFRLYVYLAYTQLMLTFFGSYIITSSYLLSLTIELRILNDSYAEAPANPQQLIAFLKDRVVYKVALLQHIRTVKRQMNVSILLELVFIVCLLAINGLRLCTTTSNLSEVTLSGSMIMIYLLELFQYCWQVDEMELLHEGQAFAVYSTPWNGAIKQSKALLLITIRMAQVPLRFMCGGMYQLSTELFGTVLQFIYSLIMMLLHFKESNISQGEEPLKSQLYVFISTAAMLIRRPRSKLEVGLKTLCLSLMVTHSSALTYDLLQQRDIRLAMDMLCMLSLFVSIIVRSTCMRQYISHIHALERLEKKPTFRVGTPYAEMSRRTVVSQNYRYLGLALVAHSLTVTVYTTQNMTVKDSFVKIITYFPIDLSERYPTLDTMVQLCYSLTGYVWAWYHAATQLTIIVLLRFAITEFQVFLHSLDTLDDQIDERLTAEPGQDVERVLLDILHEHARYHSQLIEVVMHLRTLLRTYSLVHFAFYMIIVAAFMTRFFIIPGSSTLGMVIPMLVTVIFLFETFGLCMLVEMLVQLNRKVGINLYGFNWPKYLRYGNSIKRTMTLMIMQANTTEDFSAGGLTTVSADLFAKSCRLIYTMMMAMANLAT
uniref:Uncharacterized protein n=1 Tax=Anopheles christyi TaxID=43041 RepID=A0A182KAD4_9DIPT